MLPTLRWNQKRSLVKNGNLWHILRGLLDYFSSLFPADLLVFLLVVIKFRDWLLLCTPHLKFVCWKKIPLLLSSLKADASEKLRQSGLSHNHPHPVLLTTVRDCPLVPPPPPVQIPRWKLIRQKKKKQPVEPALTPPEPPKDPQFLEVVSPFLNHKVSPIPVNRAKYVGIRFVLFSSLCTF